jgi:hypothetical protein
MDMILGEWCYVLMALEGLTVYLLETGGGRLMMVYILGRGYKVCAGPRGLVEGCLEFLPNCRPDGP